MDPNALTDILREEIERHLLHPGMVLKQEELADRFEVSRQPVRQALDRLLMEGLVVRRSDRSLVVAELTASEARDLVDIRVLLESQALRLSLPKLGPVRLRKARRLAEGLVEETEPAAIEELDVAFHTTLYGECPNMRLLRLIDALRREGRRAYASQPPGSAFREVLAAQHLAILDACAAGDERAAVRALSDHLQALPPNSAEEQA